MVGNGKPFFHEMLHANCTKLAGCNVWRSSGVRVAVAAFFIMPAPAHAQSDFVSLMPAWGWWALLVGACVVVAAIVAARMLSMNHRRRISVFFDKNFLRNRYDYRREWLRLIETLVGLTEDLPLRTRAVKALADIIDSRRGELWMRDSISEDFIPHGSWGCDIPARAIARTEPLASYLEESNWVVDTVEYHSKPEIYSHAFSPDEDFLTQDSVFVPVLSGNLLLGIVRIERPEGLAMLSYEDHDILKTAGQQVAVFLTHERAQEALFETRQFEAFTKLTTFLMHDLKNMIAKQDLLVANAQRFKHRPEFVDDAIATIASSAKTMHKILDRLQGATRIERTSRIDLVELIHEVSESCSDRRPVPRVVLPGDRIEVQMDRDRLVMAVTHLIRNAQDATDPDGFVELRLAFNDGQACIEVEDSGSGMAPEFIRTRLFRPFDSTKGAQGMGIGAYQIRETMQMVGGSVDVLSQLGVGTTMRIHLPAIQAPVVSCSG